MNHPYSQSIPILLMLFVFGILCVLPHTAFAAAPTLFAGNIFDDNGDGTVDKINIVFSNGVTTASVGPSEVASDWTYSGGSIGGALGTASFSGGFVYFTIVGANPNVTGGTMPTVSYNNTDNDNSIANADGPMSSQGPITLNDGVAPTISSVSSGKTNGSYRVGEVIDIDVTFSETVTSTGSVTVTLETGTTDRTCTFTVSSSTTGTCDYTVQSGDTTSDLTVSSISGTIRDASFNSMSNFVPTTNLAANKALVVDTTAPTVQTLSPADNATGISAAASFVITFSEAVDVETGDIRIYRATDNTLLRTIDVTTGFVTGTGTNTITVNSNNLTASASYYVQIDSTAFDDAAGNSYAGIADATSWNFDTIPSRGGSSYILEKPPAPHITVQGRGPHEGSMSFEYSTGRVRTNEVGFEYWSEKAEKEKIVIGREASTYGYRQILTGLSCDTEYTVRGYAMNSSGTTYSVTKKLVTSACEPALVSETSTESAPEAAEAQQPLSSVGSESASLLLRDLSLGMDGTDIRILQEILIARGGTHAPHLARVGATGFFGRYTEEALREYQAANSITPRSGYFGPLTRAQMKASGVTGVWW